MTRKEIFGLMRSQNDLNFNDQLEYVENYLISHKSYSEEQIKDIKRNFARMKSEMKHRWVAAKYRSDLFEKTNEKWLNGTFELPLIPTRAGRPAKPFEETSERGKRRKTETIRLSDSPEKIIYAAQMELRAQGNRSASNILKEISENRDRAKEYRKSVDRDMAHVKHINPEEALAMFVDANLSRSQYERIRQTTGNLPCYSVLQLYKKQCYPSNEFFSVTETCAEVNLQGIMNHTAERLLIHLEDVLKTLSDNERDLQMICKWGCDGSQQAQFKQKFENDSGCDSHIFQSSFVPLRLVYGEKNKILWHNTTPSSPRYCRPIRIRFLKETVDITNDEINNVEAAAKKLEPISVTIGGRSYVVKTKMMLTMIDAKVCNAATGTKSTMRCYICGAQSKDFNDLNKTNVVNTDTLKFGLSTLHARIRLFENLLHIAYKLGVQDLPPKSEADKLLIQKNKEKIQNEFKNKLGLRVDFPKAGFGNTNDGNTSRRFFENPELAAEITGLDINFIKKIKVILECISCGYKIDAEKFKKFTTETAALYVSLYGRHNMTPTMHKILMHGATVIEDALLPIGQLSEEAAEARNKHFRLYRQNFARKFSRLECNTDVLNRLLLTSDPLLASRRIVKKIKQNHFMKETLEMLICEESYA